MKRYLYMWGGFAAIFLLGLVAPRHSLATKPSFHHVFDQSKKKYFISKGRFTGGEVDRPINLVDLRFHQSKTGERERLQIKFADQNGKVLHKRLGYTHVSVESQPPRVVVDLDQVMRTSVDGPALRKILEKSQMISGSDMTMDPQDHSTNITLQFKESQSVSVFTQKDRLGELSLTIEIRDKKSRSQ